LAAAVRTVLTDANAYGLRARETARRDFSMDTVAGRLITAYAAAVTR
jgi:hypothetical protein